MLRSVVPTICIWNLHRGRMSTEQRRMSRSVVPTICIWKPPSGTNVNRTETNVKVGGCTSKHLLKYSQVYSQFNLSILTLLLLLTYCRTILLPYSSSTAVICPAQASLFPSSSITFLEVLVTFACRRRDQGYIGSALSSHLVPTIPFPVHNSPSPANDIIKRWRL